jgi:hypothetical protein
VIDILFFKGALNMTYKIQQVVLSSILLLFSSTGYTISKDKHQVVTINAINAYQNCLQKLGLEDSLKAGVSVIAEATKEEDESPLLERYFNWHFYDAYRETDLYMGLSLTRANKSLHCIYNKRVDSLVSAIKNENIEQIYKYTGSVIHYIQDMTVPAHVAPIYHYNFIIDKSDYFDEMPEWLTGINPLTVAECNSFNSNSQDINYELNSLLNNTAEITRTRIKQVITASQGHELNGKTWEQFWVLRDPNKEKSYPWYIKSGFSHYGEKGNEGWKKFCEPSNSINRGLCMSFFNKSHTSAIYNSVRALLLINNAVK